MLAGNSFKVKCTGIAKLGSSIDWQYGSCATMLAGITVSKLNTLILLNFVVVLAHNTVPVIQCWLATQVQS